MQTRARITEWLMLGVVIGTIAALPLHYGFVGPVPSTVLKICIYAIMALGLNIVLGYTGQLDLGYVTFMSTGMVITAVACVLVTDPATSGWVIPVGGRSVPGGEHVFHFPGAILLVMLVAGLVCAVIGVIRGLPTLHLTGDYYAIVTLGLAEIIYIYYKQSDNPWTGGPKSISFNVEDTPSLFGERLFYDTPTFYFLVFAFFALAIIGSVMLRESRVGRAMASIRLDPTAAATCGIPVNRFKMLAFAASGFVGGVGGSLYALWAGQFSAPAHGEVWESILLVCVLVLGGMGSVRGALLGAIVLVALGEVLREPLPVWSDGGFVMEPWPQQARFLFYGIILIVLMRFRPDGVLPDRRAGRPLSDEKRADMQAAKTDLYQIGDGK